MSPGSGASRCSGVSGISDKSSLASSFDSMDFSPGAKRQNAKRSAARAGLPWDVSEKFGRMSFEAEL